MRNGITASSPLSYIDTRTKHRCVIYNGHGKVQRSRKTFHKYDPLFLSKLLNILSEHMVSMAMAPWIVLHPLETENTTHFLQSFDKVKDASKSY